MISLALSLSLFPSLHTLPLYIAIPFDLKIVTRSPSRLLWPLSLSLPLLSLSPSPLLCWFKSSLLIALIHRPTMPSRPHLFQCHYCFTSRISWKNIPYSLNSHLTSTFFVAASLAANFLTLSTESPSTLSVIISYYIL
jgi:hypothetical protein